MKSPLSSRVLQDCEKGVSFDIILAFVKGVFLLRGIRGIIEEKYVFEIEVYYERKIKKHDWNLSFKRR